MKEMKLKLPKINFSRSLLNDRKESNKITECNIKKTFNLIKIPRNVRAINSKRHLKNMDNISKVSKQKNEPIKSFILKKISLKHYNLKPKFNKKIISSQNLIKSNENIENLSQNVDKTKIFNKRNKNRTNDINFSSSNLYKLLSVNSDLKKENNIIRKKLIKNSEEKTNENELYNDTEIGKKEQLTFFIDKNNIKKIIKNNQPKKIEIRKDILKTKPKVYEDFQDKNTKFIPNSYRNIRTIKSFRNITRNKPKNNFNIFESKNYSNLNEPKNDKIKSILRKKLRNLGNEMTENKKSLKKINDEINSCFLKATAKLKLFAKSIEEIDTILD